MAYLFTSESVSEGHPDKVADQISDAILDAYLEKDPECRVAVETLVTTDRVVLAGEVRSVADIDVDGVARRVIRDIGYTDPAMNFSADSAIVESHIHEQSEDIAQGVDAAEGREQGAGDQGMMFGYACRETKQYMPLPLTLAHCLVRELARIRKQTDLMPYLGPDSKSQVTVRYGDGAPKVHTVVLSTQHAESVDTDRIRHDIETNLLPLVIKPAMRTAGFSLLVNPTGKFVKGGPDADAGLTGRKIIVDTYGGRGAHGGGAFSGKDPSKVDRSAAYAARHVAKNIVAAGLADSAEVQIAYAIGEPDPVSIHVDCCGTGRLPDEELWEIVRRVFPLSPAAIIRRLNLLQPIYRRTAAYGHFGRKEFPWERLDAVKCLQEAAPAHSPGVAADSRGAFTE